MLINLHLNLPNIQNQKINYVIGVVPVIVNQIQNGIKNNREHINKYRRVKRINDETFRLALNPRSRLRKALVRQLTKKNEKTEVLLGISFDEFKKLYRILDES